MRRYPSGLRLAAQCWSRRSASTPSSATCSTASSITTQRPSKRSTILSEPQVGRAVLEALGPEIDGDQALYELPTSPEVRAFLTECRDCEWETIDCGESTDPERSADVLATAERLLLDFEPEGSALFL